MTKKPVKLACSNVNRYLGKRPARCGCATCRIKFLEVQLTKALNAIDYLERVEANRQDFGFDIW